MHCTVQEGAHRIEATSLTEFSLSLLAVTDQIHQSSQEAQEHTQTLTQNQYQSRTISQKNFNFTIEFNTQNQNRSKIYEIHIHFKQVLRDSQESSSLNWWSCNPNANTPPEIARCKRDHNVGSEKKKEEEVKDFTGSGSEEERKEWNQLTRKDSEPRIKRNGSNLQSRTQVTLKLHLILLNNHRRIQNHVNP